MIFFSLIFGYAGYYILNRRKDLPKFSGLPKFSVPGIRKEVGGEEEVNTEEILKKSPAPGKPEPLVEKGDMSIKKRYLDIISLSGYFEGYHFLIGVLFWVLAGKYNISYKKSMTVNEFMQKLCAICEAESDGSSSEVKAGTPVKYIGPVTNETESFIRLYEKLVYRGVYDKGDELSLYCIFEKITDDLDAGEYLRELYAGGRL